MVLSYFFEKFSGVVFVLGLTLCIQWELLCFWSFLKCHSGCGNSHPQLEFTTAFWQLSEATDCIFRSSFPRKGSWVSWVQGRVRIQLSIVSPVTWDLLLFLSSMEQETLWEEWTFLAHLRILMLFSWIPCGFPLQCFETTGTGCLGNHLHSSYLLSISPCDSVPSWLSLPLS